MTSLTNRYDFVLLFEVTNGNPNGDPDAGNLPRMDPETSHGLVSDVSLKRKIRNYVELAHRGENGKHIYVEDGSILNEKHRQAYIALKPEDKKTKTAAKLNPQSSGLEVKQLQDFMCSNFYDVRSFGAVMSTGINCGQLRGPVQMTFATSVEPIVPSEITITRMAATNEAENTVGNDDNQRTENRTMGRKHIVPYGLYRAHGFISAKLTEQTGFDEADLDLLLTALESMFEHDRSAARGEMATRKLLVFKHQSALGNAQAHSLFDRVKVGRNMDGTLRSLDDPGLGNLPAARKFSDYKIEIDRENWPAGVELIERV